MRLTIEIHDGWMSRPDDLRKIITTLVGLECPPSAGRSTPEPEPADPESLPRTRPSGRHPGNGRHQVETEEEPVFIQDDEDPPADGRQLLGWAAKQLPDAKGRVIGYGKKRGFPSRILDWTPQQVAMAYHAARALTARA